MENAAPQTILSQAGTFFAWPGNDSATIYARLHGFAFAIVHLDIAQRAMGAERQTRAPDNSMRLLVYNIRYATGGCPYVFPWSGYLRRTSDNLRSIIDFMTSVDPDVMGLLE